MGYQHRSPSERQLHAAARVPHDGMALQVMAQRGCAAPLQAARWRRHHASPPSARLSSSRLQAGQWPHRSLDTQMARINQRHCALLGHVAQVLLQSEVDHGPVDTLIPRSASVDRTAGDNSIEDRFSDVGT